ncbi:MAG: hypothetical protein QXH03_02860 [Candidatus Bathyarchaeia archaeon]
MAEKLVTVCLLHGKKCYWQSLKTFMAKTNHPMQVKTCRFPDPCSQKLIVTLWQLAAKGPCEKAENCPMKSEACKLPYNKGAPLPKIRWINCLYGVQHAKEKNTL